MRLVRLSYLAPDITKAILDGRQPGDLTAEKAELIRELPMLDQCGRISHTDRLPSGRR